MKAKLTGGHVVAAIFAGIIGNLLFSAGWASLGVTLLGGVFAAVFGGSISAVIGSFTDPATIEPYFDNAGGVVAGLVLGFGIGSVVLMLLGFLISGWILKGGKVRKPWATSWTATLISALLTVPLLLLWFAIANNTDGLPIGIIVVLGTAAAGILIWLWMTWAHRGYVPEVESVETVEVVESSAAPVTPSVTAKKETPPASE